MVGHSYGGSTAALVAARAPAAALVFVAGMVPATGERPADWWSATGHAVAVAARALADGGLTGSDDPFVTYYHDVPRALAEEALGRARGESPAAYGAPWPLAALPAVPTSSVLCAEDRSFPAAFVRRLAAERLGVLAEATPGGHCAMLSRPRELAGLLHRCAGA